MAAQLATVRVVRDLWMVAVRDCDGTPTSYFRLTGVGEERRGNNRAREETVIGVADWRRKVILHFSP